jgi:hypothetical protein
MTVGTYGIVFSSYMVLFLISILRLVANGKRMVAARRIAVVDKLKLHCDMLGTDDHVYIILDR